MLGLRPATRRMVWADAGVGGAHSTNEAGESRWRDGALVQGVPDGADGWEIDVSLETPEKIEKFRMALYEKAKQEPKYRFYLLYDKVYRADVLDHAITPGRYVAASAVAQEWTG